MTPDALVPADADRLAAALEADHGVPPEALSRWTLRTREDEPHVYAASADLDALPVPATRAGVRLGCWTDHGFRLSIDGAHLLEDHLTTVVDVGDDLAQPWLAGDDVPAPEGAPEPFVVLRWRGHVIGSGPVVDGTVENHLPRDRRLAHPPWEGGPPEEPGPADP